MRNINKKILAIIVITLIVVESGVLFLAYKSLMSKETVLNKQNFKEKNDMFAIMLEQSDGTFAEGSWPNDDYEFNAEKSGCIDRDGNKIEGALTFDDDTYEATVTTTDTSYCFLYFNIIPPTVLDDVRYIRDCINGNSVNNNNEWVEIQAYKDGVNVALNKTASGSANGNASYIVDGVTSISETKLSVSSTTSTTSSYDSEVGGYNIIKRMNFATSAISVGDIIIFQFDTYSVDIDSVDFNDIASNGWTNSWPASIETLTSGLHIVDINDPTTYIVSGYINVISDMIPSGSTSRFIDIKGVALQTVTTNYVIKNPNYYLDYKKGSSCVKVDLGATYDLDEVKVWHYYKDRRSYNNHYLYVSSDNSSWTSIISNQSGVTETSSGKSVTVSR